MHVSRLDASGAYLSLCVLPSQVRAENQQLRLAAAGSAAVTTVAASNGSAAAVNAGTLRKQLKEFTLNTQLELERSLKSCESRAVMAEEQLAHLQVCVIGGTTKWLLAHLQEMCVWAVNSRLAM